MTARDRLASLVLAAHPDLDGDVPAAIAEHGPDDPIEEAMVEVDKLLCDGPQGDPGGHADRIIRAALLLLHGAAAYKARVS